MSNFKEARGLMYQLRLETCLVQKRPILQSLESYLREHGVLQTLDVANNEQHREFFFELSAIVSMGVMVIDFVREEEREYERRDFIGIPETAAMSFRFLQYVISVLESQTLDRTFIEPFVVPIVILCAAHSDKDSLWTSEESMHEASIVLDKVVSLCKCSSVDALVQGVIEWKGESSVLFRGIMKSALCILKPRLMRTTWKRNPSIRQIFKWFLLRVKSPILSDYMGDVLPPSLLFIDDHVTSNKVLGIQCLHHIIENATATELQWNGRSNVLYHGLFHLLYTHEPEVVTVLHPCMLSLLSKIEVDLNKPGNRKNSKYDEVYSQVLVDMEFEQRIALRHAYIAHMWMYIDRMGIAIVRHMKRTLRVLKEYLEVFPEPQEETRKGALKALKHLIVVCWPRIPSHCDEIFRILLRLSHDISYDNSTTSDEVKAELTKTIKECLLYLRRTCSNDFMVLAKGILAIKKPIPGKHIIEEVMSDPG